MKRIAVILLIISILIGCGGTGFGRSGKGNRFKVQRPGQGYQLEEKISTLIMEEKRVQAMRLCNDILFSSRSSGDREIANYWRTIIQVIEQIEEQNYDNAVDVIGKNSKWWKSQAKDHNVQLIVDLLNLINEQKNLIKGFQKQVKKNSNCESRALGECVNTNESLNEELNKLKLENKKLLKALLETEVQ